METVSTPMQDDSSGANPSSASVKSDDSSPRHESGRGSPPPNCAICLGTCRNKSFTDSCLHQFCFKCLLTWSRVKAECPLCKQNFRSIIHNVRSNHQYEEYMVEQRQTEEALERLDFESLSASTRRFRYRTTLTLPRRETIAIQQLLLQHYPIMADVFPPPAPRTLPARRRRSPAAFRRTVYRHNLWARPLPDFTGRFRDCSPEFYRYNDSQMHRLVPWLNRELHYLLNENIGHISYVIARILELLPQYHVNSTEFREAMQVYFRDRTEHFLHELYCFASTPYDMTGYDRNVQYTTDTRISTMVNEVISSSESEASVDSDIVMVSSSGPADPPPGPSRPPAPVYPQNYIPQPAANNVIPIETISQSDTDDDDEVMVVGYIKPPQDRTPEVVDLLGSDSDVIVQDAPAEPQPQTSEAQEARQAPLVKLILKRHAMDAPPDSDSDDSSYTPPPRRRRRPRSGSATTSDTCRSTPEPAAPPAPASEPEPASSPRDSSSPSSSSSYASCVSSASSSPSLFIDTDTPSSSSEEDRKRRAPRSKRLKRKRDVDPSSAERRRSKSRKSRPRRDRRAARPEKDKAGKRKPNSGKGAKAARRTEPAPAPTEEPAAPEPGPSGSGAGGRKRRASESRKRRRPSRESKRLRSVVNVMYNTTKKNGEASSSGGAPGSPAAPGASRVARDSDSDDDLPLNLTVQKTYLSL